MIVVRGIVTIYSASSFSVAFYNELAQAPNPWEQYNHSLMSCIRTRDWGFREFLTRPQVLPVTLNAPIT